MEQSRYFVHLALAVANAMGGLFQSVYCCIFYTFGMALWNSLLLLLIAVYGVTREHVGACVVMYAHLALLAMAIALLTQCGVGLYCLHYICETHMWTKPIQDECVGAFADRPDLLSGLPRIHTAILLIIGTGAVVQVGVVFFFMARSIWAFIDAVKHHVNVHYFMFQSALSIVTLLMGFVHTLYCAHLYFTLVGVWCPLFVLIVSIFTNIHTNAKEVKHHKCRKRSSSVKDSISSKIARKPFVMPKHSRRTLPSPLHRRLHYAVIVCSALLLVVSAFGIYCRQPCSKTAEIQMPSLQSEQWLADGPIGGNGTSAFDVVLDKAACSRWIPPRVYHVCYNNLQYIGFWHSADVTMEGLGALQLCLSIGMCASAVIAVVVGGTLERGYRRIEAKLATGRHAVSV